MKKLNPLAIAFALLITSCKEDSYRTPIPPDQVVRKYQEFIDQNNFNGAKALSTRAGKTVIDEIASTIDADLMDEIVLETQFHSIRCKVIKKVAECYCDLEDQYERYEALFNLVQIKGRWLIDIPEETPELEIEEIVEEIIDQNS